MRAKKRKIKRFGSVIVFSLFILTFGCSNQEIPEELYGEWVSDHPQYAYCTIEITEDWIIFSRGLTHKLFYSITQIEETGPPGSDQTPYNIHYEDEDGYEYTLSCSYVSTREGDFLQLKHQKQLRWHRKNLS